MRRVFLDANVFFAAVASRSGGSYFILGLAKREKIEAITVAHALAEAERNIERKLGRAALLRHHENLLAIRPRIQSLAGFPRALEERFKSVVPEKDLPILLGAFMSGAEFLVTLDRKHLLDNPKLRLTPLPFVMVTPGSFLERFLQ